MNTTTTQFLKKFALLFILAIGIAGFFSCKKNDTKPAASSNAAPATVINQTFVLKVYDTTSSYIAWGPYSSYGAYYNGPILILESSYFSVHPNYGCDFAIYANINNTGTYMLGNASAGNYATYDQYTFITSTNCETDSVHTGTVTITTYNPVTKNVAGTFKFKLTPNISHDTAVSGSFNLVWQ